jgi:hypothetical protein
MLELAIKTLREFANDLLERIRHSSVSSPTNCGALS